MSKEMLGGCCVCSDERGWAENPLVYCDGLGCTVAVHQACYGIVSVPTGPWYCRKCESQERLVRVKCELCPSKDGALKRTDNNGWAHVVCALYIPEVRFGNVTTMEPIILTLIPQERYNRPCYICQDQGKGTKATSGACMQCNKAGCKQQFHVTCAQALGLLCEEAGNFMDNVKYCGYCQHHNSKLKKGGNVKPIPPYKPVATAAGEHDSSPEKESGDPMGMSRTSSAKKKSYLAVKPPKPDSPVPDLSVYSLGSLDPMLDSMEQEETGSGVGVTLKIGTTSSHSSHVPHSADTTHSTPSNKFTTSNFIETVVTQSEPVFGSDTKTSTSPDSSKGKKRKSSSAGVRLEGGEVVSSLGVSTITSSSSAVPIKNVSVTLSHIKTTVAASASKNSVSASGLGKNLSAPSLPAPKSNLTVYGTGTKITIAASRELKTEAVSVVTSAPPAPDKPPVHNNQEPHSPDVLAGKRPRSSSVDKGRKPKRPQNRRPGAQHSVSVNVTSVSGLHAGQVKEETDSPPGSPDLARARKKVMVKEEKDVKPVVMNVPHMLGNQLNPMSSMAQKMHDSLNQELEAHSIYSPDSHSSALVGPPLPRKSRATNNDKTATLSAANSLLSLGNPAAPSNPNATPTTPAQPQGLENLLERQWEQGSQFLMEQAQHFDIASLLSCLHQLKSENLKLEEHVASLQQRRDHLLAVNARLTVPMGGPTPQQPAHPVPAPTAVSQSDVGSEVREAREGREVRANGGDNYMQQMHVTPSPPVRSAPMPTVYTNAQARRPVLSQYQSYPSHPSTAPTPPQMGIRRDEQHQQM